MAGSILGNRVLRKEDPKFLTTGGKYIEDLNDEPMFAGALHVTYVRSTVAHAKITNIDLSECKNAPGVVAVFTALVSLLSPVMKQKGCHIVIRTREIVDNGAYFNRPQD